VKRVDGQSAARDEIENGLEVGAGVALVEV
jgi:hypothetical protein